MTGNPYNPDDLEFLASRSLDEDLSDDEGRRLREALSASESLRSETEKLRAVDHLVKQWGSDKVELDWSTHSDLTVAKALAAAGADTEGKLDDLLQRLGDSHVEIDESAFTQAVMNRVRPERTRRPRRSLVFRLGTPLAAAAMLALAVTAGYWARSLPSPHTEVVFHRSASPDPARTSIVSFSRKPIETVAYKTARPGISFMAIGVASAADTWQEENPPL